MSDADSEWDEYSDYSDHPKNTMLEKSLLSTQKKHTEVTILKRSKSKNKFKNAHRRKKCICIIGALALVTSVTFVLLVSFSKHENITNFNKQKSILVLNWHSDIAAINSSWPKKCRITTTPTIQSYDENYENYDAIVVNSTAANILLGIDKILNKSNIYKQLRIFATEKPLQYNNNVLSEGFYMNQFAKTLSYSLQSDFVWQPYRVVRRNDSKILAPSLQPQWNAVQVEFKNLTKSEIFLNEVKEPSPLALTVMQRPCLNARKELLQLIMESMDVHTYGVCGKYNCPDNCQTLPQPQDNKRYKFYLAFEEELCADYVGENFFKALDAHLVPVVFGGANYTRFAPPNSYINARDFASIRELTDHLLHLDQNPEENIKYFTWHEAYEIRRFEYNFDEICDYLESMDGLGGSQIQTKSVEFWLQENKCQPYQLPSAWRS